MLLAAWLCPCNGAAHTSLLRYGGKLVLLDDALGFYRQLDGGASKT